MKKLALQSVMLSAHVCVSIFSFVTSLLCFRKFVVNFMQLEDTLVSINNNVDA